MSVWEDLEPEVPEVRTLTDLVKHIENTLGWCPSWNDPRPLWKVRAIEVGKLKRVIAKRPDCTMENLLLAVDYLARHRQPVESPVYVAYAVERALKERGRATPRRDLDDELERARASARALPDPDLRRKWERRLAVAQGAQLREALDELFGEVLRG